MSAAEMALIHFMTAGFGTLVFASGVQRSRQRHVHRRRAALGHALARDDETVASIEASHRTPHGRSATAAQAQTGDRPRHAASRRPASRGDALPAAARRGSGARHPDRVRGPLRLQPRGAGRLRRHGLLLPQRLPDHHAAADRAGADRVRSRSRPSTCGGACASCRRCT